MLKAIISRLHQLIILISRNKVLFLILLVAALLRFVGTKPGYNQFHADEGITYSAGISMVKNGNLDPLRYDYPALVPFINYTFFKLVFVPLRWTQYYVSHIVEIVDGVIHLPIAPLEAKKIFQIYVLGERDRNALFWGRYVTALFSLGNVFLTYLLAKKMFNKNVALIAAFFLTFNFKNVINSHVGLPDIYNAFFTLLVFIFSWEIAKNPSRKNYLLGGLAVGLSFSVKYQVFGIFPFILAHIYQSFVKGKFDVRRLVNPNIFLSGAAAALITVCINPYHIVYFDKTYAIVKGVSEKYAMGVKKLNLYPFSYFYHIDYGAIQFVTIILGFLIALRKYLKNTLIILSFFVPFAFVFFYYSNGGFYVRNFITVAPIFMIMIGICVWVVFEQIKNRTPLMLSRILLLVFLIAAVFVPARNSIINSYSYTKPWGYDIMRPWVQQNLPKDVVVASHPFDAVNLGIKNKTTEFEIAGAYSIQEHKEAGAKYAVMDLNWAGNPFYYWMSFGLEKVVDYWNKPLGEMRNTFHGVAAEEYFRYQSHSVTKPWQAPDTHLIITKLPEWDESGQSDLINYNFDKDSMGWSKNYNSDGTSADFSFDQNNGHELPGSIVFNPGGASSAIRIISMPIQIREGHLYKAEGFLKTERKLEGRERDGFIRIDFYDHEPNLRKDIAKQEVAMLSSVSARVYGTDDWANKFALDRAPEGAKYMTISFQTYITTKTKIWLDDVTVSESKEKVEDITKNGEYDNKPMDLNYIYPNSHGNL